MKSVSNGAAVKPWLSVLGNKAPSAKHVFDLMHPRTVFKAFTRVFVISEPSYNADIVSIASELQSMDPHVHFLQANRSVSTGDCTALLDEICLHSGNVSIKS